MDQFQRKFAIKKQAITDHVYYYVDESYLVIECTTFSNNGRSKTFSTFSFNHPAKNEDSVGFRKICKFSVDFDSMVYAPHGFKDGLLVVAGALNGKLS